MEGTSNCASMKGTRDLVMMKPIVCVCVCVCVCVYVCVCVARGIW